MQHNKLQLTRCLEFWKHFVFVKKYERELEVRACQHHRESSLLSAVKHWRGWTRVHPREKALRKHGYLFRRRKSTKRFFAHWRARLQQMRAAHAKAGEHFARRTFNKYTQAMVQAYRVNQYARPIILRRYFVDWRSFTFKASQSWTHNIATENPIFIHSVIQWCRASFPDTRAYKTDTLVRKSRQWLSDKGPDLHLSDDVSLYAQINLKPSKSKHFGRLIDDWRVWRLTKVFRAWKHDTKDNKVLRRNTLMAWFNYANRVRMMSKLAEHYYTRRMHVCAFEQWRALMRKKLLYRQSLARFKFRCNYRRALAAFTQWSHAFKVRRFRVSQALGRWRKNTRRSRQLGMKALALYEARRRKYLLLWRGALDQQMLMDQGELHWNKVKLQGFLSRWKQHMQMKKERKSRRAQAAAFSTLRLQGEAWKVWQQTLGLSFHNHELHETAILHHRTAQKRDTVYRLIQHQQRRSSLRVSYQGVQAISHTNAKRKALRAWRVGRKQYLLKKRVIQASIEYHHREILTGCFKGWGRIARLRKLALDLERSKTLSLLRLSFRQWFKRHKKKQRHHTQASEIIRHSSKQFLCKLMLERWYQRYETEQKIVRLRTLCDQSYTYCTHMWAFREWFQLARQRRAQYQRAVDASDERERRHKTKAISRWLYWSRRSKRLRLLYERCVQQRRRRQAGQTWQRWKSHFIERRRQRLQLGDALQRWRRSVLRTHWEGLRTAFTLRRKERYLMQSRDRRLVKGLLRSWVNQLRKIKFVRKRLQKVKLRAKMQSWKRYVLLSRHQRQQLQRCVQKERLTRMKAVLGHWKVYYSMSKDLQARVTRGRQRSKHMVLQKWAKALELNTQERRLNERLACVHLAQGWRQWRQHYKDFTAFKDRADDIIAEADVQRQKKLMRALKQVVEARKFDRFYSVHHTMQGWKTYTQITKRAKADAERKYSALATALQRDALAAWRSFFAFRVSYKRLRERCKQNTRNRLLASVLRGWHGMARKISLLRTQEHRAREQRQRLVLRRVWKHHRRLTLESIQHRQKVRAADSFRAQRAFQGLQEYTRKRQHIHALQRRSDAFRMQKAMVLWWKCYDARMLAKQKRAQMMRVAIQHNTDKYLSIWRARLVLIRANEQAATNLHRGKFWRLWKGVAWEVTALQRVSAVLQPKINQRILRDAFRGIQGQVASTEGVVQRQRGKLALQLRNEAYFLWKSEIHRSRQVRAQRLQNKGTAFRAWRRNAVIHKGLRTAYHRSKLSFTFKVWRQRYLKRVAPRHCKRMRCVNLLQAAVSTWKRLYATRQKLVRISRSVEHRRVHRSYQMWRMAFTRVQHHEKVVADNLALRRKQKLTYAISQWQQRVSYQRSLKHKSDAVAKKHNRSTTHQYFHAIRARYMHVLHVQVMADRFEEGREKARKGAILREWNEATKGKARDRMLAVIADEHHAKLQQQRMRVALQYWQEDAHVQVGIRSLKRMEAECVAKMQYMHQWRRWRHKLALRRQVLNITVQRNKRLRAASFYGWHRLMLSWKRLVYMREKVKRREKNFSLQVWRRAAQDSIYTRGRLVQVQEGILDGMSRDTRLLLVQGAVSQLQPRSNVHWMFRLWKRYTAMRRDKNRRKRQAYAHYKRLRLPGLFVDWQSTTRVQTSMRTAERFDVTRKKAQGLVTWARYVVYKRRRAAYQHELREYRKGVLVKQSFQAWRATVLDVKHRRLALQRLEESAAKQAQRVAWLRWRQAYMQRVRWKRMEAVADAHASLLRRRDAYRTWRALWVQTATQHQVDDHLYVQAQQHMQLLRTAQLFYLWMDRYQEQLQRKRNLREFVNNQRLYWLSTNFLAWRDRVRLLKEKRAVYVMHSTFSSWKLHSKRVRALRNELSDETGREGERKRSDRERDSSRYQFSDRSAVPPAKMHDARDASTNIINDNSNNMDVSVRRGRNGRAGGYGDGGDAGLGLGLGVSMFEQSLRSPQPSLELSSIPHMSGFRSF